MAVLLDNATICSNFDSRHFSKILQEAKASTYTQRGGRWTTPTHITPPRSTSTHARSAGCQPPPLTHNKVVGVVHLHSHNSPWWALATSTHSQQSGGGVPPPLTDSKVVGGWPPPLTHKVLGNGQPPVTRNVAGCAISTHRQNGGPSSAPTLLRLRAGVCEGGG